ncbi:hypothetical protein TW80_07895 [Loktanella sp. S4079]|nr:hypothetical protein TW80_07895 [Loktanella sp. S4079]
MLRLHILGLFSWAIALFGVDLFGYCSHWARKISALRHFSLIYFQSKILSSVVVFLSKELTQECAGTKAKTEMRDILFMSRILAAYNISRIGDFA